MGGLSNHILIFGFNLAVNHLIKAVRKKTNIPIAFYVNEDYYEQIFKLNKGYSNIFHFYGDPFN